MSTLRYYDDLGKPVEVQLALEKREGSLTAPLTLGSAANAPGHLHIPGNPLANREIKVVRSTNARGFVIAGAGVLVNGQPIETIRLLRHGDKLQLDSAIIRYLDFAPQVLATTSRFLGCCRGRNAIAFTGSHRRIPQMNSQEPACVIGAEICKPYFEAPKGARVRRARFHPGVLPKIKMFSREHIESEVGGLLFGSWKTSKDAVDVDVEGFLPAEHTESGIAHLKFTHQTWAKIREQRFCRFPKADAVGWFHTHPGFGIFVSAQDQEFHRQIFFQQPWSIALILDPSNDEFEAFWIDYGGKVTLLPMDL